jgi:hypothetical protein
MKSDTKLLIAAMLVVLLFLAGILLSIRFLLDSECGVKARGMGLEYEYGLIGACRVRIDDKLIPLELVRFVSMPDGSHKLEIGADGP